MHLRDLRRPRFERCHAGGGQRLATTETGAVLPLRCKWARPRNIPGAPREQPRYGISIVAHIEQHLRDAAHRRRNKWRSVDIRVVREEKWRNVCERYHQIKAPHGDPVRRVPKIVQRRCRDGGAERVGHENATHRAFLQSARQCIDRGDCVQHRGHHLTLRDGGVHRPEEHIEAIGPQERS